MTFLRGLDRLLIAALVAGVVLGVSSGLRLGETDAASGTGSGPGQDSEAAEIGLLNAIDNAQLCYRKQTRTYTSNLANLEETMWRLDRNRIGASLTTTASIYRLGVLMTTSEGGASYFQRVSGEQDAGLKRARQGGTFSAALSTDPPPPSDGCRPTGPKRNAAG